MGEEAPKRHARKAGTAGLEFVGRPSRSLFKQYSDRFQQYAGQVSELAHESRPTADHTATQGGMDVTAPQVATFNHSPQPDQYAAESENPYISAGAYGSNDDGRVYNQPTAGAVVASPALSDATLLAPPQQVGSTLQSIAQPFVAQPIAVDETAFAEPIAAELENITVPQDEDDDLPVVKLKHPNKETDKQARRQKYKQVSVAIVVVVCFVILGLSGVYLYQNRPLFTGTLKKEAGFPLYAPVGQSSYAVEKSSVTKGENGSIVYNVFNKTDQKRYVVSQQKLPDIVKDDAQYQQFLAQIDKFAAFETENGKAYLTKPANTGDDVTAVVKTSTTMVFVRGAGTTNDNEWTALVGSLKVVK